MRISIYELLGLIKEGKAPKKIKVTGTIYYFNENYEMYLTKKENENYEVALGGMDKDINLIASAFNEVVEIIEEEKEIENLDVALLGQCDNWLQDQVTGEKSRVELNPYIIDNIRENTLYFQRKINELIDVINDMRDKE